MAEHILPTTIGLRMFSMRARPKETRPGRDWRSERPRWFEVARAVTGMPRASTVDGKVGSGKGAKTGVEVDC